VLEGRVCWEGGGLGKTHSFSWQEKGKKVVNRCKEGGNTVSIFGGTPVPRWIKVLKEKELGEIILSRRGGGLGGLKEGGWGGSLKKKTGMLPRERAITEGFRKKHR